MNQIPESDKNIENPEHHSSEISEEQPEQRVPCEVYSRVVGYLRPVQNWNAGKQQEFRERQMFKFPPLLDG